MAKKQQEYGNDSIRQLKGADRVRKRPAVIFGSDGVEGCAHSIFEIISNSIDEARDGHGNRINVTLYPDHVVEVEDFGRGIPVDYNKAEDRWNWDLVFCELYAGGKYAEGSGNYDFSLGLNGLGLCATQYASEWMTAGRLRTRSAPFSWRILSLPYSCCFFAMRRFPLIYIETVVVFAHIFLLNHSLEVFVKSTCSLRAGCRGQMRASAPASSV